MKKEEIIKAKEEIMKDRNELDKEIKERRSEVQKQESRMIQKEENLEKRSDNLEKKEKDLEREYQSLELQKNEVNEIHEKQSQELQRIAGLSKDEAKNYLLAQMEKEINKKRHEKKLHQTGINLPHNILHTECRRTDRLRQHTEQRAWRQQFHKRRSFRTDFNILVEQAGYRENDHRHLGV